MGGWAEQLEGNEKREENGLIKRQDDEVDVVSVPSP